MTFARPTKEKETQKWKMKRKKKKSHSRKSKIKIQIDFRIKHFRESSFCSGKTRGKMPSTPNTF